MSIFMSTLFFFTHTQYLALSLPVVVWSQLNRNVVFICRHQCLFPLSLSLFAELIVGFLPFRWPSALTGCHLRYGTTICLVSTEAGHILGWWRDDKTGMIMTAGSWGSPQGPLTCYLLTFIGGGKAGVWRENVAALVITIIIKSLWN